MVPAAIVDDISFTFCGDDPPTAPLRCIAELHTNTEFPTITAFGISDKPPTWKKFREYKSGTRWIRWKNWKMSLTPKFCFTFSEDNKRVFLSFYRKDTSIKKQWLYPSIPTTAVPKPPFILCAPIEVEWPELADKSDVCDEIVDCEDLIITNEDGSPATDTILRNGTLDFKTTGNCCGNIVWSVSPTTGGTTISAAGVLHAGSTSCGSLLVTASCPECETSATQYVRVTDAGQWVLTDWCTTNMSYNFSVLVCDYNVMSGNKLSVCKMYGYSIKATCEAAILGKVLTCSVGQSTGRCTMGGCAEGNPGCGYWNLKESKFYEWRC